MPPRPTTNASEVLMEAAETLIGAGRNFPYAVQLLKLYLSSPTVEQAPAFKAHYLLGTILEKQGNREQAAEEYRASLSMAKSFCARASSARAAQSLTSARAVPGDRHRLQRSSLFARFSLRFFSAEVTSSRWRYHPPSSGRNPSSPGSKPQALGARHDDPQDRPLVSPGEVAHPPRLARETGPEPFVFLSHLQSPVLGSWSIR